MRQKCCFYLLDICFSVLSAFRFPALAEFILSLRPLTTFVVTVVHRVLYFVVILLHSWKKVIRLVCGNLLSKLMHLLSFSWVSHYSLKLDTLPIHLFNTHLTIRSRTVPKRKLYCIHFPSYIVKAVCESTISTTFQEHKCARTSADTSEHSFILA